MTLLATARHEIAHALVAAAAGWQVDSVTVACGSGQMSGRCWISHDRASLREVDDLFSMLCILIAPTADIPWPGGPRYGPGDSDRAEVSRIIDRIIELVGDDVVRVCTACREFAHGVLEVYADDWEAAAVKLATWGRLDGAQLAAISPAFLPRPEALVRSMPPLPERRLAALGLNGEPG